jgi:hypothetical protein
MDSTRRTARIAGVLFAITFVAGIGGALAYGSVLDDPNYVTGAGGGTRVFAGAFLEILTAMANIGTAIVLFPILKRQSESLSLGYVASRIVESVIIVIGILSLLSVVTLRQDFAGSSGADAASFVVAGKSLVAIHDWAFLLGPGLLAGFGNGILLGYLLYRSGLVPRRMALLGLVAGPVVFASGIAVLFGAYEQVSTWSFIATVPEIAWEASLTIWLLVKGFKPSPITTGIAAGTPLTRDVVA